MSVMFSMSPRKSWYPRVDGSLRRDDCVDAVSAVGKLVHDVAGVLDEIAVSPAPPIIVRACSAVEGIVAFVGADPVRRWAPYKQFVVSSGADILNLQQLTFCPSRRSLHRRKIDGDAVVRLRRRRLRRCRLLRQ